ncbi:methionyl-tRNA formyltransferase [Treponema parvum]|uniref:Methionyl-tRNA formyltransferase n=1 Tax=Treponema parvum TaxID=138851 RepID=A0A975F172_9SPIR|nr:methionyl-tRNA formyltransferase [Treponema parvum]QTQ12755.1 methionyl-tRNA formyltransferase [Treponema parvum]
MLKVLYAGSPGASAVMLELLLKDRSLFESGVVISSVLTNPPAPRGRHRELIPTPVHVVARNANIPVFTPEHLDGKFRAEMEKFSPDILVCFAYGHIFGPKFLATLKYGGINLHPSLLPKYRGCSPVPQAILNRDKTTGISIQKIALETDTGDLLYQKEIPLDFTETADSLLEKSAVLGAAEISRILKETAAAGNLPEAKPQKGDVSYTFAIKKEDSKIRWDKPAEDIEAMIRAYTSEPGCFTTAGGVNLKILKARISCALPAAAFVSASKNPALKGPAELKPGTAAFFDKKSGIYIACAKDFIVATELQWQFKKAMNYIDFMNGSRNFIGTTLQ